MDDSMINYPGGIRKGMKTKIPRASRKIKCPRCGWVERANVALKLVKIFGICLMGLCFT